MNLDADPPRGTPQDITVAEYDEDPRVQPEHASASGGLGMLLEFVAHLILGAPARTARIPVVVNGTVVGTGFVGRECVSIDFSHGGDPLDVRHMRCAFSAYQWHAAVNLRVGHARASLPRC